MKKTVIIGAGVVLAVVAGIGMMVAFRKSPAAALTAAQCQHLPAVVVTKSGVTSSPYWYTRPPDDAALDLRAFTSTAFGPQNGTQHIFPIVVGQEQPLIGNTNPLTTSDVPGARTCVVGGTVIGQQGRNLTWDQVKHGGYDGAGLSIRAKEWFVVNGLRVDNVEDGIRPVGPHSEVGYVRNIYMTYIRDDCIENDWAVIAMRIRDSLFDGCFMGISERPAKRIANLPPTPPNETLTLEHVLLRLEPMPHDPKAPGALVHGRGNGQLFKWSRRYGNHLVLNDSILRVDQLSLNGHHAMRFPSGTTAKNVTLVWLGPGNYPAAVPSGVTVTKDKRVWDHARAEWLRRHGCPPAGDTKVGSCTRLTDPSG